MEHRDGASAGGGFDCVLSDGSEDRHGTRINPDGWDLTAFRRNPIALYRHGADVLPIGRWENVRVEAGQLLGRLVMAAKGTSARIDELASLVAQGILRAVSVGGRVLQRGVPGKSKYDIERVELLEVSLVEIGSNPNALMLARSLHIPEDALILVFGEHAEAGRGSTPTGGHADPKTAVATRGHATRPPAAKVKHPMTLSERIIDAQSVLNARRDRLAEITNMDALDLDAIEALNGEVEVAERTLTALKATEQRIGVNAGNPAAPAVNRRPLGFPQREVGGFDLVVRAAIVNGISHFGRQPIQRVLDDRYPGHEATHNLVTRADQTIGTTSVAGWASELMQTVNSGFLQALTGVSIYPQLRARGVGLNFDGLNQINLPRRNATGAGGGFVAEGSPIRVGKITTASASIVPKKMGVIVPFSRELARRSTPAIEAIVRQAILEDTAAVLDSVLLDNTAISTTRPAGLRSGVTAVATGYGGGDHTAVKADFQALLGPFISANAADNIIVIMNPAQALAISMMDGPANSTTWFNNIASRVTIVESTYATANRLVAIRGTDFYTAMGDAPEFDISESAVVHMEDTSPAEIVTAAPVAADPVRSFWQTGTIGVRMLMDVSWALARTGTVQWIDTTTY